MMMMLITHVTERPMNKRAMLSFSLFERPFIDNINFFDNLAYRELINVKFNLIIFLSIFVVDNDVLLVCRIL